MHYERELLTQLNCCQEISVEGARALALEHLANCGFSSKLAKATDNSYHNALCWLPTPSGILNPSLHGGADEQLRVFLVRAQRGRFQKLIKYMEGLESSAMQLVLLGEFDVALLLHLLDAEATEVADELKQYDPDVQDLKIDDTTYCFGVHSEEIVPTSNPVQADELNALVSDYRSAQEETLAEYFASHAILGRHYVEPLQRTRRVFSLIGVNVPRQDRSKVGNDISVLLRENGMLSRGILNIHTCIGRFDFLLEAVCDDVSELSQLAQGIRRGNASSSLTGNDNYPMIETSCFVAVDSQYKMPRYPDRRASGRRGVLGDTEVRTIEERLLKQLTVAERELFFELSGSDRILVLDFWSELMSLDSPIFENGGRSDILDFSLKVIHGYLSDSTKLIVEAVSALGRNVESLLYELIRSLTDGRFGGSRQATSQLGLKSQLDAGSGKQSIATCIRLIDRIRRSGRFGHISPGIQDSFMKDADEFRELRNLCAHKRVPPAWARDIHLAMQSAREAGLKGFRCLRVAHQHLLTVPLQPYEYPPDELRQLVHSLEPHNRRFVAMRNAQEQLESHLFDDSVRALKAINAALVSGSMVKLKELWKNAESTDGFSWRGDNRIPNALLSPSNTAAQIGDLGLMHVLADGLALALLANPDIARSLVEVP